MMRTCTWERHLVTHAPCSISTCAARIQQRALADASVQRACRRAAATATAAALQALAHSSCLTGLPPSLVLGGPLGTGSLYAAHTTSAQSRWRVPIPARLLRYRVLVRCAQLAAQYRLRVSIPLPAPADMGSIHASHVQLSGGYALQSAPVARRCSTSWALQTQIQHSRNSRPARQLGINTTNRFGRDSMSHCLSWDAVCHIPISRDGAQAGE